MQIKLGMLFTRARNEVLYPALMLEQNIVHTCLIISLLNDLGFASTATINIHWIIKQILN